MVLFENVVLWQWSQSKICWRSGWGFCIETRNTLQCWGSMLWAQLPAFVGMKGPKCNAVLLPSLLGSHFLSRIIAWIHLTEAWDRRWCQRRSSFWEDDRFVFAWCKIFLTVLMSPKNINWMTKRRIPEALCCVIVKSKRYNWKITMQTECCTKVAAIIKDIVNTVDSLQSVTTNCLEKLRRTWGLRRRTSAFEMWYPRSSTWTESPFTSCNFQMPSLATLFEDDRSLICILLSLYVMKSDLFGEMQTDAPESMIHLNWQS